MGPSWHAEQDMWSTFGSQAEEFLSCWHAEQDMWSTFGSQA
jgi:hypothetical protein